jgi:hypothetical protein
MAANCIFHFPNLPHRCPHDIHGRGSSFPDVLIMSRCALAFVVVCVSVTHRLGELTDNITDCIVHVSAALTLLM